jgi:D-beta-D-heptose 7-phosphate kinase/D-beta-D-heptose 1-phosphate adenosyltransferase
LLKPNYEEAIRLLSLPYAHQARIEQLKPYGSHFQQKTNASLIALTLDEDGALFFQDGQFVHHSPAPKVNEPHVSGAGDTFVAALLLSLVSGAMLPVAAEIAAAAASIAISRKDTAVCTDKELAEQFGRGDKIIHMTSQLKDRCRQLSAEGKRVIFTNGCFDILHSGHVNYLRQAREMGDVLIVGLNNDESIRRLKGKERPVNTLDNRIEVLSALACVDYVVPFGSIRDDSPVNLIKIIHPDVFVKGGDYKHKHLSEEKLLRRIGCQIAFIPFVYNQSTTKLISKVQGHGHLKIAVAN